MQSIPFAIRAPASLAIPAGGSHGLATGGLIRSTEQGEDVVKKAYDSKGYPNEALFTQGKMCERSRIIEYCDLMVTVLEP